MNKLDCFFYLMMAQKKTINFLGVEGENLVYEVDGKRYSFDRFHCLIEG